MASIRERRRGVWEVRVSTGRTDAAGRPVYVSRTVHGGKREAQRVAAQLQAERGGTDTGGSDPTVAALLNRWMDHIRDRGRAPSTLHGYRGIIDRYLDPIAGLRVGQLTAQRLDRFYADLVAGGLSPLTVHHVHRLVHAALHQAERWDLVDRNVASRATPPPAHAKRNAPPTPDALVRALAVARDMGDDIALFVRLAAITGCRRGELVALRWSDVDLDAATVTVQRARTVLGGVDVERGTKTRATRRVALDAGTVAALRSHRAAMVAGCAALGVPVAPDPFVLAATIDGAEGWMPDHATYRWGKVRDAAGLGDVRLHDLRHWMVTTALAGGVDLATVGNRAGHADGHATTLRVYAHGSPVADRAAADVLGSVLDGDRFDG